MNLPENVLDLLKASCAKSTWAQYDSALRRWSKFCTDNQINMWNPNVNNCLSFLTELYTKGLSYMTVNTSRSALSVANKVDGYNIGEHPLVR